jgi:hypothetical protein
MLTIFDRKEEFAISRAIAKLNRDRAIARRESAMLVAAAAAVVLTGLFAAARMPRAEIKSSPNAAPSMSIQSLQPVW